MRDNIITVTIGDGTYVKTDHVFQYDYGLKLVIEGVELPESYEVHFSETKNGLAKKVTGDRTGVDVPDEYLTTGTDIYAWVYLRDGSENGYTVYNIQIPVVPRAVPDDEAITPVEHNVIKHALEAMEEAVEQTETNVTHYPVIGNNEHWMVWNAQSENYQDTGVKARGDDGQGANLTIGEVATLPPGVPATANVRIVDNNPVLDLGLPIGISMPIIYDEQSNAGTVTIEDGADDAAVTDLQLRIIAQRTGSGTPGPRNIRNFVGYSEVGFSCNGETYTFDLSESGDVYSGTLNPLTGELLIDKILIVRSCVDMNNTGITPGWTNAGIRQYIGTGKSMVYENAEVNVGNSFGVDTTGDNDLLYMPYDDYGLNQGEWVATEINIRILLPLEEPIEVQLDPVHVGTVLGHNVFSFNAGEIAHIKYPCDVKLYIDQKVAGVQAMILEG